MSICFLKQFLKNFRPYLSKDIMAVTLLGFASGLPILLTLSTLTYWLSKYGVSKGNIGLMSLTGVPYVFKFIWAPLLDCLRIPILGRLGRRKGWIIFFQLILILIFYSLSYVNPEEDLFTVAILILILSCASASQDIMIDAFRIDYLTNQQQAYGSSASQISYRMAMLVMGAGVIFLSDYFPWSTIFVGISMLMLLVLCLTLLIKEPQYKETTLILEEQDFLYKKIILPFVNFIQRKHALIFLGFILCFKLPDAVAGVMVPNFYTDMGFNGKEIATVTKVYGLFATLMGTFLAASIINALGLYRSLISAGILMGITNLSYLLIFYSPTLYSLTIAISVENFIGGFSSALFVMFLSLLCNKNYSATQYALLSALASLGLRSIGSISGFMAETGGWPLFFIITSGLFIPALILLPWLKKEIHKLEISS